MSNAIQFLESMGIDCALGRMSSVDYSAAILALDVDDAQQRALLARDPKALSDLLGGRSKMVFAILAPDDEPGEEIPEREVPAEDDPQPQKDAPGE